MRPTATTECAVGSPRIDSLRPELSEAIAPGEQYVDAERREL